MTNIKTYIITILIFFSIKSFGQTDTIVDGIKFNYYSFFKNDSVHKLGNYIIINKKKVKQGMWIVYDKNGKTIEKGEYFKNKKTGLWTEKGEDGLCCWYGRYRNGKKADNGLME